MTRMVTSVNPMGRVLCQYEKLATTNPDPLRGLYYYYITTKSLILGKTIYHCLLILWTLFFILSEELVVRLWIWPESFIETTFRTSLITCVSSVKKISNSLQTRHSWGLPTIVTPLTTQEGVDTLKGVWQSSGRILSLISTLSGTETLRTWILKSSLNAMVKKVSPL